MERALSEFYVSGVKTTIPFCSWVLNHPAFGKGHYDTQFVEREYRPGSVSPFSEDEFRVAALAAVLLKERPSHGSHTDNHAQPMSKWKQQRGEAYRSS
jgi:propionyl-CoA carboxylase alpha chain